MRWLLVLLVACSKSNDRCTADVADLKAFIASLDLDSASVADGVHLAVRDGLPPQSPQPMTAVEITPGKLQVNGQLATKDDLVERLRDAQARSERGRGLLLSPAALR